MLALEWNMDDALQARFEEGFAEGRNEGREEGREEGEIFRAEKIAVKMFRKGKSLEEIHELTDLPLQHLEQLAKKNF